MTDARAGGEEAEVLLRPTAPQRQAGAEQAEVLVRPAQSLRIDQVSGEQTEVLLHAPRRAVTLVGSSTAVMIKWPDGTWHTLQPMT